MLRLFRILGMIDQWNRNAPMRQLEKEARALGLDPYLLLAASGKSAEMLVQAIKDPNVVAEARGLMAAQQLYRLEHKPSLWNRLLMVIGWVISLGAIAMAVWMIILLIVT